MPQLADDKRAEAEQEIESLSSMKDKLLRYIESVETDHRGLISGNKENLETQKALLVTLEAEEEQDKREPSPQYTEEEREDLRNRRQGLIDVTKKTIEHLPTLISQQEEQEEDPASSSGVTSRYRQPRRSSNGRRVDGSARRVRV
jgi:hypothetical protein